MEWYNCFELEMGNGIERMLEGEVIWHKEM
jgi:hypothetical protein